MNFKQYTFYYLLVAVVLPLIGWLFGIDYDRESVQFWAIWAAGIYAISVILELIYKNVKKKRGGV